MKEKKKLFQKLNKNTCPKCGGDHLWMVEYECTKNRLNEYGYIVESITDGYKIKLICPDCGAEYDNISKTGMSYAVKPDVIPVKPVMRNYNPFQI